jgi:hypothetical protein
MIFEDSQKVLNVNQDQKSAAEVRSRMPGKYRAEIMKKWWFIAIHRTS